MKINVISDLHAVFDKKSGNVLYNLPLKRKKDKYITAIESMFHRLVETESIRKKIDDALPFRLLDDVYIENVSEMDWIPTRILEIVRSGFTNVECNEIDRLCLLLKNIDRLLSKACVRLKLNRLSIKDICSFLYKEMYDFRPENLEAADYLIIAGDLGLEPIYDKVLDDISRRTEGKFKKILHIAGNHDHWWIGGYDKNEKRPDSVNLTHDYFEHIDGDYVFLGCTLWTPISDDYIWTVGRYMNDYRYTPGRFSPYASREQYRIQSAWLRSKINEHKDKKIVVFTHHQPFEELIHEDFKHNGKDWYHEDLSQAYVVMDHSLDDINNSGNIVLWACGHTHRTFDDTIHGIHVVRNPIGYGDLYGYVIPESFSGTWYNKIVEV